MDYQKISFDYQRIEDDEIFDRLINDGENFIIQEELQHLETLGIVILNHTENYIVIEKPNFQIKSKLFDDYIIQDCDQKGKLMELKNQNLFENNQNIQSSKTKLVIEYLKKIGVRDIQPVVEKNYIRFSCPVCTDKSNLKCIVGLFTFEVKTFSQSDCIDEKHQNKFAQMKKDLKAIWNNSKDKKQLTYSLNLDYINGIIKKKFPHIIREKDTGLLFVYRPDLKHYVEMVDNEIKSDLETLIYDNFFNDDNSCLTRKQVSDLKHFIVRSYSFPVKNMELSRFFNMQNGIYDFKTRELYSTSHEFFFNYCSPIYFDKEADSMDLKEFIQSVITEDESENVFEIVQNILGFIHYDGIKLQKGIIFEGTKKGRNGKGTLAKLIAETIGVKRSLTMSLSSIEGNTFATYQLKGKKLYIEDDYKKDYILPKEVEFLNKLISNASEIVHQKNKPAVQIKYEAVPIIQVNRRLKLKADDDGGFYQRFVVINFKNEYGDIKKRNEFLYAQLIEDKKVMSTMFNWLVMGYERLMYRKENMIMGAFFKKNETKEIEEWIISNNPVIQFFNDNCEKNDMYKCSSRDLYNYYLNNWNKGSNKFAEKKFILMLCEEFNLEKKRIIYKGEKITVIIGIKCDIAHDEKYAYQKLNIPNG